MTPDPLVSIVKRAGAAWRWEATLGRARKAGWEDVVMLCIELGRDVERLVAVARAAKRVINLVDVVAPTDAEKHPDAPTEVLRAVLAALEEGR